MASVRLHHPTFASCNYVVELPQEMPFGHNRECFTCKQVHRNKSIHLRLDANGDVFVAEGILALLRTVPGMAGLEVVPGRNAPGQIVGAIAQPTQLIYLPNGTKYVPGWNKYQAEQRMQKPFEPWAEAVAEHFDRKDTAAKAEKRSLFIFGKRTK